MTVTDDVIDIDHARDSSSTTANRRPREGVRSDRPTRSAAAQRAIDRRSKRLAASAPRGGATTGMPRSVGVDRRVRTGLVARLARIPFVVQVLALLACGLGLSLWLSTMAAQDSYQIGMARNENQALADSTDALKRTFESGNSAPELSDQASRLGLVPAQNPARMVVGPDGKERIIGEPAPATGRRMATINPDTQPNPTAQIDPQKVDDSMGLPGAGSPTSTAPTSTAPSPTASDSPAPASPTPASPTPASPTAAATPAPSGVPGAPNVLPSSTTTPTNPPGGNSRETP